MGIFTLQTFMFAQKDNMTPTKLSQVPVRLLMDPQGIFSV